jgi:soluble lytic murein transglycosylase
MRSIYLLFIGLTILFTACQNSGSNTQDEESDLKTSIETMEEELFNSGASRIDRQKAIQLIRLYTDFASKNPSDPLSPEYLFKASDISMNLNRPVQTIKIFDKILNEYPDYEKTPTALFLKAFVYEDQLKDFEKAGVYYRLFLEKYPDNEFADDAEVSLKNLGKTPEELIKEFEERQSQQ